jgi:hypothetical protein
MSMKTVAAAMTLAVSLFAAVPATAHAEPVPTVDDVVAIMAKLTDPGIPAVNKGDIVSPGFSPDEAGTIDDHLNQLHAGGYVPLNFDITNIQPAPDNSAGATMAAPHGIRSTPPGPIVLIDQGGHWLITHDTAMTALDAFWHNATRPIRMHVGAAV